MNRKIRTARRRSRARTRPSLERGCRAPRAAACSRAAAGSVPRARQLSSPARRQQVLLRCDPPPIGLTDPVADACADGSNSRARSDGSRPERTRSTIWRRNSGEYGGRVFGMTIPFAKASGASIKPGQLHYRAGQLPQQWSCVMRTAVASHGIGQRRSRGSRPALLLAFSVAKSPCALEWSCRW